MKRKLLLIGGGGHCRSVLDSALAMEAFDAIGIVDPRADCAWLGVPVVGADEDIPALIRDGWNCAFVTVGSVGDPGLRRRLDEMIRKLGLEIPVIADPTAVIAKGTEIGEGCYLGKRAVVNTGTVLGRCAILNTGAIAEHDCRIGDFAHISTGAALCGQVSVGADTHIGAGSVVRQGIAVGRGTLVGAGSVVVKDLPDHVKAYGNPCRVV